MVLARTTAVACILAILNIGTGVATAAQNDFDIDLKELRNGATNSQRHGTPQPAPPASLDIDLKELRRIAHPSAAKPGQRKHYTPTASLPKVDNVTIGSNEESIYIVRPGDNLFLILMKQYGMSNQSAEQLIPEIMRINNIGSPKGLIIGQRLRIPLVAAGHKGNSAPVAPIVKTDPQVATSASDIPTPLDMLPSLPASISISAAPPCKLAHSILDSLGLLTSPTTRIEGDETVNATYSGRNITIACGLSPAELYTYERLLARNGMRLVTFKGDESANYVIAKLATNLGLVFRKSDPDSVTLPQTYIFAPFGVRSQELQLTITPSSPAPST